MGSTTVPDRAAPQAGDQSAVVYAVLALGIAWWILFRTLTAITLEDALITFRYAQNLALGHGFVFNPGERVLGTTTPLLTLFLALAGKALGVAAIPPASALCMMGCGFLTAILVDRVLEEIARPTLVRVLFLVLYFGSEDLVVASTGGMETPLVMCLMAGSSLAFVRHRPVGCLALCALLVLTRIDGVIWAGIMTVALTAPSRKVPWKALVLSAGLVLPWVLFALWYFGSPLPNSIAAKLTSGTSMRQAPLLSPYYARRFMTWYLTQRVDAHRGPVPPGAHGAPRSGRGVVSVARGGTSHWDGADRLRRLLCALPLCGEGALLQVVPCPLRAVLGRPAGGGAVGAVEGACACHLESRSGAARPAGDRPGPRGRAVLRTKPGTPDPPSRSPGQ